MKVCFVNSNLFWGGAEKWHVRAASYLREKNHDVLFIARAEEVGAPAAKAGIEVRYLPFRSDLDVTTLIALTRVFRRFKPDALIFNSERDLRLGGMAGILAGVKTRIHRKGITGIKNNARYRWVYRNLRTHTICVSKAVRDEIAALGWVEENSLRVIYNGVNTEDFLPVGSRDLRNELGVGADRILVGALSRLSSIKGLDYLLRAIPAIRERAPNVRFALVGTGRVEDELKSLAKNLGVDDVVAFPGFRSETADALRSFDVVVHPSVSTEGFPNSIIEAMSCGKPVVASRLAGIPESVSDGETGILAPPRDEKQLAEAILKMITDESFRKRAGEQARKRAVEHFRFQDRMAEFESWLASIV